MNIIKTLAAFIILSALGRAESAGLSDRVIELPPVMVEATRLSAPVVDAPATLDEVRAEASLALRTEMRHVLGHARRGLASNQHRTAPTIEVPAAKPNA